VCVVVLAKSGKLRFEVFRSVTPRVPTFERITSLPFSMTKQPQNTSAQRPFETSGTTHRTTLQDIPAHLIPAQCRPFTNCSHKTGPVQFVSGLPAVSLNTAVFLFSDSAQSAVTYQWCFTCCQNTVRFSLCLSTPLWPTVEMTLSPLYTNCVPQYDMFVITGVQQWWANLKFIVIVLTTDRTKHQQRRECRVM
jgi:hypothetical protein